MQQQLTHTQQELAAATKKHEDLKKEFVLMKQQCDEFERALSEAAIKALK